MAVKHSVSDPLCIQLEYCIYLYTDNPDSSLCHSCIQACLFCISMKVTSLAILPFIACPGQSSLI